MTRGRVSTGHLFDDDLDPSSTVWGEVVGRDQDPHGSTPLPREHVCGNGAKGTSPEASNRPEPRAKQLIEVWRNRGLVHSSGCALASRASWLPCRLSTRSVAVVGRRSHTCRAKA